jgi:hypothetical protein
MIAMKTLYQDQTTSEGEKWGRQPQTLIHLFSQRLTMQNVSALSSANTMIAKETLDQDHTKSEGEERGRQAPTNPNLFLEGSLDT